MPGFIHFIPKYPTVATTMETKGGCIIPRNSCSPHDTRAQTERVCGVYACVCVCMRVYACSNSPNVASSSSSMILRSVFRQWAWMVQGWIFCYINLGLGCVGGETCHHHLFLQLSHRCCSSRASYEERWRRRRRRWRRWWHWDPARESRLHTSLFLYIVPGVERNVC